MMNITRPIQRFPEVMKDEGGLPLQHGVADLVESADQLLGIAKLREVELENRRAVIQQRLGDLLDAERLARARLTEDRQRQRLLAGVAVEIVLNQTFDGSQALDFVAVHAEQFAEAGIRDMGQRLDPGQEPRRGQCRTAAPPRLAAEVGRRQSASTGPLHCIQEGRQPWRNETAAGGSPGPTRPTADRVRRRQLARGRPGSACASPTVPPRCHVRGWGNPQPAPVPESRPLSVLIVNRPTRNLPPPLPFQVTGVKQQPIAALAPANLLHVQCPFRPEGDDQMPAL